MGHQDVSEAHARQFEFRRLAVGVTLANPIVVNEGGSGRQRHGQSARDET